ncbi:hypothetical protein JCM8097_000823 [Rhodosporidiobolus ruineniae]
MSGSLSSVSSFSSADYPNGETRSDDTAPKRSFADFPKEVQARIVGMCEEQDHRFRKWLKRLEKDKPKEAKQLKKTLSARKAWYGRSVGALFEVSKDVSALAAQYRFSKLKSSKVDLTFKCSVATSHLRHFRRLTLDGSGTSSVHDTLPFVPHLRNLVKLALHGNGLYELFNRLDLRLDPSEFHSLPSFYAAAVFPKLDNVRQLRADWVYMRDLLPFAQLYSPSLRSLSLNFPQYDLHSYILGLGEVLSAAPQLEELRLTYTDQRNIASAFNLSAVTPSFPPPLQSLNITTGFLHVSHLGFASVFSSSLEALSLTARYAGQAPPAFAAVLFSGEAFPSIRSLTLGGNEALMRDTMASATSRHFPVLEAIELDFLRGGNWDNVLSHFDPSVFPSLQRLRMPGLENLEPTIASRVVAFASQHDLHLDAPFPSPAPTPSPSPASSASDSFVPAAPVPLTDASRLRKTLAWIGSEVDEAEKDGNSARLSQISESLRDLDLQRQAEEAWAKS